MTGSPRFAHLDDLPWQEVRRQRHGDREVSVREKWLDFCPGFLSLYAKWDPGMIVQPHGHNSNHVVYRARRRDDVRRRALPQGHAHRARPGRHVRPLRRRPRRCRAVRGDDGRPPLVPRRSRGLCAVPGRARRRAAPQPADRDARSASRTRGRDPHPRARARRAARRRRGVAAADRAAGREAALRRWSCWPVRPICSRRSWVGPRRSRSTACCPTATTSCWRCAPRTTAARSSSGTSTASTRAARA